MARTVVLIFLLDTLPEFPINLNQTLQESSKLLGRPNYTLQECNPNFSNTILEKAYLQMKSNNSNWKLLTKEDPIENRNLVPDSVYREDTIFDNSIPNSDELQNVQDNFIQNDIGNYSTLQKFQEEMNSNYTKSTDDPESPPFLVAIFETLSNVTAHTCAGTLLSAHWVVTAASCVGVLSEFYRNSTKSTEKSHYTIVAGSSDPLVDGSIHNVTDILLRPSLENMEHYKKSSKVDSSFANLAMMKINPGLAIEKMKIIDDKKYGSSAMVYGWTLVVNESSPGAMLPTSISVKMTASSLCQSKDSGVNSTSALCFNPEPMAPTNSAKPGVGGPVLVRRQMLGVVLDDRVPLLVEPLAAHPWIQLLLNKDYL